MSQPYDTSADPVVKTTQIEICGCLMQIDTTSSGAVLLNGDLVQAFRASPQSASPAQSAATAPLQLADAVQSQLNKIADDGYSGCGQNDVLWERAYSRLFDRTWPPGHPERELALALCGGCYTSPQDLAAQSQLLADDGCCSHGFDPHHCPVGCGESPRFAPPDPWDEPDAFADANLKD